MSICAIHTLIWNYIYYEVLIYFIGEPVAGDENGEPQQPEAGGQTATDENGKPIDPKSGECHIRHSV